MGRNWSAVVLSGGVAHDFPATSSRVAALLADVGADVTVREDVEAALADLDGVDLLVCNLLRWRMQDGKYAGDSARWGISVPAATQAAVEAWMRRGGGLLALHAASICFDDWPGWRDLIGARWNWRRSQHPPLGPATVTVHPYRHPIVAGLPGSFGLVDEIYGFLDYAADVYPLVVGTHGGAEHPLVWARRAGAGRIVHDALGHHVPSFEVPEHRRILQRAALWALGRPDGELTSL